jgi:hypothetical protein
VGDGWCFFFPEALESCKKGKETNGGGAATTPQQSGAAASDRENSVGTDRIFCQKQKKQLDRINRIYEAYKETRSKKEEPTQVGECRFLRPTPFC